MLWLNCGEKSRENSKAYFNRIKCFFTSSSFNLNGSIFRSHNIYFWRNDYVPPKRFCFFYFSYSAMFVFLTITANTPFWFVNLLIVRHFISILTEGIRTLLIFFFINFKKKKNRNPTFNKPKKKISTLNNQVSTKIFLEGQRFIINWGINKTEKSFPYFYENLLYWLISFL